jgi:aminopeptidase N
MEHQTIIAYGNRFRHQDFDYDWLHHHELAHEWWGNLVTCRDWKDMWIHEGFGTYMQALYIERKNGPEDYRREMASKRRGINGGRAIAPRETQDSKQIYFGVGGVKDNDIYFKGSWVLHTLRWLIGDEAFFTALRRMCYPDPELEQVTDGSQVRFVDTEDFRAVAEQASGRDLGWFFELYLRRPEMPELVVRRDGSTLELEWKVPEGLEFPMPVPVKLGRKIERVELPGGTVTLHGIPRDVEVDPEERILKAGRRR